MIAEIVTELFERIGHQWKIGDRLTNPSEDDVEKVLDEAAKKLYDGAIGDRLEVGGLIVEKATTGHDVYVYVGRYL